MNFHYINKEGKIYKEQAGIGLIEVSFIIALQLSIGDSTFVVSSNLDA